MSQRRLRVSVPGDIKGLVRSRHHVVSQGFMRFFADGKRVLLCDKTEPTSGWQVRLAGTSDVFVRDHFNSYREQGKWVDRLEDDWQPLETRALTPIRSWIRGTEILEPNGASLPSREETKVLAAIHFARSYGYRDSHERIALEVFQDAIKTLPSNVELIELWRRQYGADPTPRQVEAMISERFTDDFGATGPNVIQSMRRTYNLVLEKLIPLHVQALHAPPVPSVTFVLGDTPFVYYAANELKVGGRMGLALGEADRWLLPLSPHLAVMFSTSKMPDQELDIAGVQKINNLTWRAAQSQIICHPRTDFRNAIAGRPLAEAKASPEVPMPGSQFKRDTREPRSDAQHT
ncbi:MAG: DUF4238 domain-containing protein [Actinomycetota bacterium]